PADAVLAAVETPSEAVAVPASFPAEVVAAAEPAAPTSADRPAVEDDAEPASELVALADDSVTGLEATTDVNALATEQAALAADPSDYSVAGDTIEVQALETLGHYADWLGLPTQRLRDLTGIAFRE